MVGPHIPVTESEIIKPWPIGGFQLVDCLTASRGTKAGAEKKVPPETSKIPKEGQKLGKDDDPVTEKDFVEPSNDDSIIDVSQGAEEPEAITINNDEGAVTTPNKPEGASLDSGEDRNHSHPSADQSKPGDHMLGSIHPDEPEEEEINNLPRGPRAVTILPNTCLHTKRRITKGRSMPGDMSIGIAMTDAYW